MSTTSPPHKSSGSKKNASGAVEVVLPPYVSKAVQDWGVNDVFQWARQYIDEEEAVKLRKQKIKGSSLLKLTEDRLRSYDILGGPAVDLLAAVQSLAASPGVRASHASGGAKQDDKDDSRQIADFLHRLSQQKQQHGGGGEDNSVETLIMQMERNMMELAKSHEQLCFRVNQLQQELNFLMARQLKSPLDALASFESGGVIPSPFLLNQAVSPGMPIHPIAQVTPPVVARTNPGIDSNGNKPANFSRSPTPPKQSENPSGASNSPTRPGHSRTNGNSEPKPKTELKLMRKGPRNRVKWTPELIELFQQALKKLGEHAVPSAILDEMNVEGLTRENVASHLQKHRLQCAAKMRAAQQPNGFMNTTMASPSPPSSSSSSYSSSPTSTPSTPSSVNLLHHLPHQSMMTAQAIAHLRPELKSS